MEILKSVGRVSRTGGLIFILVSAVVGSLVCASAASAQTLTALTSLDVSVGAFSRGGLIADANGNLFGTTYLGGANGYGTVFEITNSAGVYSSTPITVASFDSNDGAYPFAGLVADAHGNLFGTTALGGANGLGTVFEIANNSGVYADTPTPLASFSGSDGANPYASLIVDANGNLFGTTSSGGAYGYGEVFEIVNSSGGYIGTPKTLASFDNNHGASPYDGLIADANGNLFGTTYSGGADGVGTVFEITNSSGVYDSTPITLASFTGIDGARPYAGLIADADGNLFGTTYSGGAYGSGTVFEIANTSGGYAGTPAIVASFDSSDGALPYAGLIADARGNLFGTTVSGGAEGLGTVFEVTGSGFVPPKQFAGTPGASSCVGLSISTLAHTYGGAAPAAAALGYASVKDLQRAVASYCVN